MPNFNMSSPPPLQAAGVLNASTIQHVISLCDTARLAPAQTVPYNARTLRAVENSLPWVPLRIDERFLFGEHTASISGDRTSHSSSVIRLAGFMSRGCGVKTLTHEMAHFLLPDQWYQSHGPMFLDVFARLLKKVVPAYPETLEECYKHEHSVDTYQMRELARGYA